MTSTYDNIIKKLNAEILKMESFEPQIYRYHITIAGRFYDVPSIYWEQEDELLEYLITYFKNEAPEVFL